MPNDEDFDVLDSGCPDTRCVSWKAILAVLLVLLASILIIIGVAKSYTAVVSGFMLLSAIVLVIK